MKMIKFRHIHGTSNIKGGQNIDHLISLFFSFLIIGILVAIFVPGYYLTKKQAYPTIKCIKNMIVLAEMGVNSKCPVCDESYKIDVMGNSKILTCPHDDHHLDFEPRFIKTSGKRWKYQMNIPEGERNEAFRAKIGQVGYMVSMGKDENKTLFTAKHKDIGWIAYAALLVYTGIGLIVLSVIYGFLVFVLNAFYHILLGILNFLFPKRKFISSGEGGWELPSILHIPVIMVILFCAFFLFLIIWDYHTHTTEIRISHASNSIRISHYYKRLFKDSSKELKNIKAVYPTPFSKGKRYGITVFYLNRAGQLKTKRLFDVYAKDLAVFNVFYEPLFGEGKKIINRNLSKLKDL